MASFLFVSIVLEDRKCYTADKKEITGDMYENYTGVGRQ